MLLDPYNQTDHPECKSRPDSGLSAITELDPGYITGIPFVILFILLILVLFLHLSLNAYPYTLVTLLHKSSLSVPSLLVLVTLLRCLKKFVWIDTVKQLHIKIIMTIDLSV